MINDWLVLEMFVLEGGRPLSPEDVRKALEDRSIYLQKPPYESILRLLRDGMVAFAETEKPKRPSVDTESLKERQPVKMTVTETGRSRINRGS